MGWVIFFPSFFSTSLSFSSRLSSRWCGDFNFNLVNFSYLPRTCTAVQQYITVQQISSKIIPILIPIYEVDYNILSDNIKKISDIHSNSDITEFIHSNNYSTGTRYHRGLQHSIPTTSTSKEVYR